MATTVAYAKERKQFGRAIGSYQAVSHACAQMSLETEGARSVTYWAAWALDHDPETARMAANCAKAYASDAAVNVNPFRAAGPRRDRLHLGARPAPVPQARRRSTRTRSGTPAGTASKSPVSCLQGLLN